MPALRVALALAAALALLAPSAPRAHAEEAAGAETPEARLVLVLVVDQLRRERLDPALPGGLGRLAREGRVYSEVVLDHAVTETAPGHATILTGRHPGPAGIPGNEFFVPGSDEPVYCVGDAAPEAATLAGGPGRSPHRLRVPTLGAWLKDAHPQSRVFAVSGKDRGAILLGGHEADAAYWLAREGAVGFTTSRAYRDALPGWLRALNGGGPPDGGFWERVPAQWTHLPLAELAPPGLPPLPPDDRAGESAERGRTSGHPIDVAGDPQATAENLYHSPYLDQATLEVARALVREEALGSGPAPDLLAVSLSAIDTVGHAYGPSSHESRDALLRLDAGLEDFLAFLEARVGDERLRVVLTSDHGVLPLPETLAAEGELECPLEGGRAGLRWLGLKLLWDLHWELSPWSLPAQWVRFAGSHVRVPRALAAERGVAVPEAVAAAERLLEASPAVAEAWTAEETRTREGDLAELYRHSFAPERSGDLAVQLARHCLVSPYEGGTTHGTPYLYDRAVPLVFRGPGAAPGRVAAPARTVDVAPTVARWIGVDAPEALDGRPLFGAERGGGSEPGAPKP